MPFSTQQCIDICNRLIKMEACNQLWRFSVVSLGNWQVLTHVATATYTSIAHALIRIHLKWNLLFTGKQHSLTSDTCMQCMVHTQWQVWKLELFTSVPWQLHFNYMYTSIHYRWMFKYYMLTVVVYWILILKLCQRGGGDQQCIASLEVVSLY